MATSSSSSSSSSKFSGKSDDEIEEMLDRMLTRLALCDDPNLQNLLAKLLPVTISSLSRSSSAVRNKVMEILGHVNKRVKHHQQIGLPLEELWQLYMEDNAALMVRNFCIVYVEMAFDRVSKEKKEDIAPAMIANISKLPPQHQDIILRIVLKAKIDQLKLMGPVILSGVLKSLDGYTSSESDPVARETKTFAYQAIGLLAKRLPLLFRTLRIRVQDKKLGWAYIQGMYG